MMKHEEKLCARCQAPFECKVGSISLCQCRMVTLTDEERVHINKIYADCLCANCMKQMKGEFHNSRLVTRIKKLLRMT